MRPRLEQNRRVDFQSGEAAEGIEVHVATVQRVRECCRAFSNQNEMAMLGTDTPA